MKFRTLLLFIFAITTMWLLRVGISGSVRLNFLIVNVLLAALPFLIEYLYPFARHFKGLLTHVYRLGVSGLWLLFLPNTFYVLTDFMHLNANVLVNKRNDGYSYIPVYGRGDGLYVYDSLLIFFITIFGAYMGGLALVHAYRYFVRTTSTALAYVATAILMTFSAIGVYIGRFGRFNSWQGITHPWAILTDFLRGLSNSSDLHRFMLVSLSVLILEVLAFSYVLNSQRTRSLLK